MRKNQILRALFYDSWHKARIRGSANVQTLLIVEQRSSLLLSIGWLLVICSACQRDCAPNEVIGETSLMQTSRQLLSFTEERVLSYRDSAGNRIQLTRYESGSPIDDQVPTYLALTCDEAWIDKTYIVLTTQRVNTSYENADINLYLDASVRFIEQPNPYDTLLYDELHVGVNYRNQPGVSARFPLSLRGNTIPDTVLQEASFITPFQVIADTTLLNQSLQEVYYTRQEETGSELFVTQTQGIAAFRVNNTLWVRQ